MRTQESDKCEKREDGAFANNANTVAGDGSRAVPAASETNAGSGATSDKAGQTPATEALHVQAANSSNISVSGMARIYPDLSRIEYEIYLINKGTGGGNTFKSTSARINLYEGSSVATTFWMKWIGDYLVEPNQTATFTGTITPSDLRYPDDMRLIYNGTCYLDIECLQGNAHIQLTKHP